MSLNESVIVRLILFMLAPKNLKGVRILRIIFFSSDSGVEILIKSASKINENILIEVKATKDIGINTHCKIAIRKTKVPKLLIRSISFPLACRPKLKYIKKLMESMITAFDKLVINIEE